jgi:hypothetical protein
MGRLWPKQIAKWRAKQRKEKRDKEKARRIVLNHFAKFAKKLKLLRKIEE